MNFTALRLFLHIMQRGSLNAAARQLNLSPSAASRQLSHLERSIGLKLFRRDRQRLVATELADQYYSECYRVLAAVDELPRIARRLASGTRSRLRLVAMPRVASCLVLPAVARFTDEHPEIDVTLEVMTRREIERTLASQSFDLGIVVLPFQHPAIMSDPLLDLPLVAVSRKGHALSRRSFLRARDLARERIVTLASGSRMRLDLDEFFAAEGLELHPHATVSTLELACRLVLQSDFVTITDLLLILDQTSSNYCVTPLRPARSQSVGIVQPPLALETQTLSDFRRELMVEVVSAKRRIAAHKRTVGTPR